MSAMAGGVKRLDVNVGDLLEIDGRRYAVVPGDAGGVAIEQTVAVRSADLHQRHGTRPISRGRFDELFGDLPRDQEG